MRFTLAALLLSLSAGPAAAQTSTPTSTPTPAASPEATPFPAQDQPGDVPRVPDDFDEAIRTPGTPEATPTPDPDYMTPEEAAHPPVFHHESDWNPENVFPGNYYALPLSLELALKPCLKCSGDAGRIDQPGELSVWAGYAFQLEKASSSPFVASGLDYTFYETRKDGTRHARSELMPTVRWGWTWTAANAYVSTGMIVPGEDRDRAGLHVGVGGSSFPLMIASVCLGEIIPSIYEVGYDWLPRDPVTHETRNRWVLKVGWGF